MFVQVIRGRPRDEAAVLQAFERWESELRPTTEGFLGSTSGVAADGEFVAVVRFADAEAARRNSERAEQGAWWAQTEQAFDGEVEFFDSNDVEMSMGGGTDDAGFVQIMVGRGDRQRAALLMQQGEEVLRRERPDIIGGITAWRPDGSFVDVAYFTSESEAREGEAKELSDEGRALFEQFMDVMSVEQYLDLNDPRFT